MVEGAGRRTSNAKKLDKEIEAASKNAARLSAPCPVCGKEAVVMEVQYNVPHFGDILITTITCPKCGFKFSDAMTIEGGKPVGYKVLIESEKDLETKVVRASTSFLKIPELGIEIIPGPEAEGFFSNVEGVIERAERAVKVLINPGQDEANESRLARRELKRLQDARKGLVPFELIIEDPMGCSALIGSKVKKYYLSKDQAELLTRKIEEGDQEDLSEEQLEMIRDGLQEE